MCTHAKTRRPRGAKRCPLAGFPAIPATLACEGILLSIEISLRILLCSFHFGLLFLDLNRNFSLRRLKAEAWTQHGEVKIGCRANSARSRGPAIEALELAASALF